MTNAQLPNASLSVNEAIFAVCGQTAEFGSGIISYHNSDLAAVENANFLNARGDTVKVESIEQALGQIETINSKVNHYNYLDKHLDSFWKGVFGKSLNESFCAGIVSAHGDKGRGYQRAWAEAGICFPHGMALFMLTYTNIMNEEKHRSKDWVILNFSRFRPLLANVDLNDQDILR